MPSAAYDEKTVSHFGEEWARFDHAADYRETLDLFKVYFARFPFDQLTGDSIGADIGCGTGRWARHFTKATAARLICLDPGRQVIDIAERNLTAASNTLTLQGAAGQLPFPDASLDFAYSIGVLHHVPDTEAAVRDCARVLRAGAPFLCYLYYALETRPWWYRSLWRASDVLRRTLYRAPQRFRALAADAVAIFVYYPFARASTLVGRYREGWAQSMPLSFYSDKSLYWMRNCALDRLATPIESRYTLDEIRTMLTDSGLRVLDHNHEAPFWTVLGIRA
jgi:SAM-dependent methyltransferase